jgi:3-phenylpropionate/trans-cinnamate dioxygenase ferredoxin reductase subunit
LRRAVGDAAGRFIANVHRQRGVILLTGDTVARLEGQRRVERVITRNGRSIDTDFVVTGLGMEPAVEIAAGTGVDIANGIVVDEYCRTSIDGIYAAGDVARFFHPVWGSHVRLEHWQHARKHGAAAARAMLGSSEPYVDVPWFWSDQYDVNVQYAGFPGEWDQVVHKGDLGSRFLSFFLKEGRVGGIAAVNQGGDLRRLMPLIANRTAVTSQLLERVTDPRQLVQPVAAK